jgi:mono/diheme cytochrome c family protein
MSNDRAAGDPSGAVIVAVIVIALVMVGVALTAWIGGRASTSADTVTVVRTGVTGGSTTLAPSNVSAGVAAGAHDYVQFGCAQCHGIGGVRGVSPDVPARGP